MFSPVRALAALFVILFSVLAFLYSYHGPITWKAGMHTPRPSFTSADDYNWKDIMNLPSTCDQNPLPKPGAPKMALEYLLPFFLAMFTTNCQHPMVERNCPTIAALARDRTLTLFSLSSRSTASVRLSRQFTPFKDFTGGSQVPSEEDEALKTAYLMLSFMAKSSQAVCGFGLLILKTFETIQMTYGGEHVVGWAVQDGTLKLDHSSIKKHEVIHLSNASALSGALAKVREGQTLPPEMYMVLQRNDAHNWLTFVTESGRIYDLDLSAFQFGIMAPFPCIVPVLSAEPTAFNGRVQRERVYGADVTTFKDILYGLIDAKVEMLNSLGGRTEPVRAEDIVAQHQEDTAAQSASDGSLRRPRVLLAGAEQPVSWVVGEFLDSRTVGIWCG